MIAPLQRSASLSRSYLWRRHSCICDLAATRPGNIASCAGGLAAGLALAWNKNELWDWIDCQTGFRPIAALLPGCGCSWQLTRRRYYTCMYRETSQSHRLTRSLSLSVGSTSQLLHVQSLDTPQVRSFVTLVVISQLCSFTEVKKTTINFWEVKVKGQGQKPPYWKYIWHCDRYTCTLSITGSNKFWHEIMTFDKMVSSCWATRVWLVRSLQV